MEFYLEHIRGLPWSASCSLHDLYYLSWRACSPMHIWQDLWPLLKLPNRVQYIRRTEFFDLDFCNCMVEAAYAKTVGTCISLEDMD